MLRLATDDLSPASAASESAMLLVSIEFRGDRRGEISSTVWVAKANAGSREIPREALVEILQLPAEELAGELPLLWSPVD